MYGQAFKDGRDGLWGSPSYDTVDWIDWSTGHIQHETQRIQREADAKRAADMQSRPRRSSASYSPIKTYPSTPAKTHSPPVEAKPDSTHASDTYSRSVRFPSADYGSNTQYVPRTQSRVWKWVVVVVIIVGAAFGIGTNTGSELLQRLRALADRLLGQKEPVSATVSASKLMLRNGPNLKARIVARLPRGTRVIIIAGTEEGWNEVELSTQPQPLQTMHGFVKAEYLRIKKGPRESGVWNYIHSFLASVFWRAGHSAQSPA